MSEIEVFRKSNNKIMILDRRPLELEEMISNFQKIMIGDLKKLLVKEGKQLLKDIFSTVCEDRKRNVKDDRKKSFFKDNQEISTNVFEKRNRAEKIPIKSKVSSEHFVETIEADNAIKVFNVSINNMKKHQEKFKEHVMKSNVPSGHVDEEMEAIEECVSKNKSRTIFFEKENSENHNEDQVELDKLVKITKCLEKNQKKIEADSRSVFIGNVEYGTNTLGLEKLFSKCGKIERVFIPLSKFNKKPKGFAYIQFALRSSVEKALMMNGIIMRGRQIQVKYKRTNIPGLSSTDRPSFDAVPSRSRKIHEESLKRTPKDFDKFDSYRNQCGAVTSKNSYVSNRKITHIVF